MSEEKAESRSGALQRDESEAKKIRQTIKAIREGHTTGGYCETEKLQAEEKKLWKILQAKLDDAKERHGYSTDPKFKHAEIRALELEINGLSWRPTLVVKQD